MCTIQLFSYENSSNTYLEANRNRAYGGYPYEDAAIPEVMSFCRKRLGLDLINLNPGPNFAEYLFRNARATRPAASV